MWLLPECLFSLLIFQCVWKKTSFEETVLKLVYIMEGAPSGEEGEDMSSEYQNRFVPCLHVNTPSTKYAIQRLL